MGLIRPPTASTTTTANGGGGESWLEAALEAKVDRTFMPHGVGHHLGLDVHDVSEAGPVPRGALLPGHVVTVEPGAYLIPPLLAKWVGGRQGPGLCQGAGTGCSEACTAGSVGAGGVVSWNLVDDGGRRATDCHSRACRHVLRKRAINPATGQRCSYYEGCYQRHSCRW